MRLSLIVYYSALLVLFVVPLFLVWCKRFSDGIGGRLGLAMTSSAAFLTLWQARRDPLMFSPLPETVFLAAGMAVFFLWYIYRFLRKQWGPWYAEWKQAHAKEEKC